MAIAGISEEKRQEMAKSLLREMETTAARMRTLIVAMPAEDLLGYIYAQRMMKMLAGPATSDQAEAPEDDDIIGDNQFLLEYVHAVLASDVTPPETVFSEAACAELFELSKQLKTKAMVHAMATSAGTNDGVFGPDTADVEFRAKSSWVLLRGNRYQVLEGEFYAYVLTPHNDVLQDVYGVGAEEIAAGFQDMSDATRAGHGNAIEEMTKQFDAAQAYAREQKKPLSEVMEEWAKEHADESKAAAKAIDDMLRGGTSNLSRHTKLPSELLADLAYERGEETDFFAAGDYTGTPFRTLPARKKPLIKLGGDYYAVDPCFTRDAGYRALLWNLLQRKPGYKKAFEDRQKVMSEAAFFDILSEQLPKATIYQEVYYKDPTTKQWSRERYPGVAG